MDNVYITTARESYEIQGRSVGSLDVCKCGVAIIRSKEIHLYLF